MDERERYQRKENRRLSCLLKKIPKGKVTTYGILAKKLRMNPQAVGKLLSKNTMPEKIPCYKVIMSDGRVGGYSGGLKRKTLLLRKDRIEIKNGKIDLKKYCHDFTSF